MTAIVAAVLAAGVPFDGSATKERKRVEEVV